MDDLSPHWICQTICSCCCRKSPRPQRIRADPTAQATAQHARAQFAADRQAGAFPHAFPGVQRVVPAARPALGRGQRASADQPLHIQLLPYASAAAGLAEQDALREYYTDLSNLRDTDEDDVERLLASFGRACRAATRACGTRAVRAGPLAPAAHAGADQASLPTAGEPASSRPRRQHPASAVDQSGHGNTRALLPLTA